ncbi:MAG: NADH-quinone oxidoreductase subunit H [Sulfurimonas sp.]|uniref:complex I subunit 1/NuoH family protein n=1 Tax=Sulfurimonas sp. TaxID=2022749 RepID=UPI002629127A|nr:complex I subunit 1 family protein [Sulfurimonas sp.]MCW8895722.1 NADH-quinone oxidoreductase subunit H [Sulfurimonas sp.]MCW8953525.1 NADH-quinone oxidoreductase subunit H [Sulfurimonas sp.]MCW9068230.1 NADH-quinone oxidoreductase subunit H [Sulfurimonas sp.]
MNTFLILLPLMMTMLYSLATVPILVWMERRIAAFIQDRVGPNRCNIGGIRLGGIIQSIADMMKLVFKEEFLPSHIKNKLYYLIAPSIAFVSAFLTFMVIPYADNITLNGETYHMQALPTELGVLWFLAFAGLGVYGIILGGWASHSKFAILGSMRATAQVISYEVAMGLALVSMLITYGTINLNEMVSYQTQSFFIIPAWGAIIQPLATIIFIVTAFAETNRAPFDAAESESEIVAGYHTEYGAMKFGLFFVAEYIAMAASGALIVTIFFGGYQLPYLSTSDLINHFETILWGVIIFAVLTSILFLRWMNKNSRFEFSSNNETKIYTTLIIGFTFFATIVMAYYAFGFGETHEVGVMILQFVVFTVKLFVLHFVFIWVRWTLPRFRYDQTQKLGWNILLPLSLANIFITAIVVVIGVNYGN